MQEKTPKKSYPILRSTLNLIVSNVNEVKFATVFGPLHCFHELVLSFVDASQKYEFCCRYLELKLKNMSHADY